MPLVSTFASRSVARTIHDVIESSSGAPNFRPLSSESDFKGESALTRKFAVYFW